MRSARTAASSRPAVSLAPTPPPPAATEEPEGLVLATRRHRERFAIASPSRDQTRGGLGVRGMASHCERRQRKFSDIFLTFRNRRSNYLGLQKDGSHRHGRFDRQSDCNENAGRRRPPDCDPGARAPIAHPLYDLISPEAAEKKKRRNGFPTGVGDNTLISLDFREENGFGFPSVQLGFPSAWAWISFSPVWNSFSPAWNSFPAGWEDRPWRRLRSRRERGDSLRDGERAQGIVQLGSCEMANGVKGGATL